MLKRKSRRLKLLLLSLLIPSLSQASDIEFYWTAPIEDEAGESLASTTLTYRLYVNTPMTNGYELWREVEGNTVVYQYSGPTICASVYVTAVRQDHFLESVPSNEISFCTDAYAEQPDEPMQDGAAPSPPIGVGVFVGE
ncbi:hypothetical protein N9937_01415 [bacterium]|nr:hypothetical protein [bacterium]